MSTMKKRVNDLIEYDGLCPFCRSENVEILSRPLIPLCCGQVDAIYERCRCNDCKQIFERETTEFYY